MGLRVMEGEFGGENEMFIGKRWEGDLKNGMHGIGGEEWVIWGKGWHGGS